MAPSKRRSLHLELPKAHSDELPQIAALFLAQFDVRVGFVTYPVQGRPMDILNSVEYKSLPSGLHNVPEDTVYFVHDDEYAGISCFVNGKGDESDRNATMLAVGALIPLSYGRLGKSWKHADGLHTLARELLEDPSRTQSLEAFWQEHQYRPDDSNTRPTSGEESPSALRQQRRRGKSSPSGQPQTRNRAVSSASALAPPGQTLSTHHPALSLSIFLDTFGPLVFPLYKAALLRKRVLLIGQAPVELACNFVYSISILSTLPSSLHSILPLSPLPTRFRPLFSVGVHDMPTLATGCPNSPPVESLAADGQAYGWVACTTDDILGMKEHLYEILVKLPPEEAGRADTKVWPKMQAKPAVAIRATQRDARRYRGLRRDLRRLQIDHPTSRPQSKYTDAEPPNNESSTTTTPLLPFPSLEEATTTDRDLGDATFSPSPDDDDSNQQEILEPQSWSALAYNSFIWWASAGEARTDREEESEYDASLLANLGAEGGSPNEARGAARGEGGPVGYEMALIAYFHRFTVLILRTLGEIIDDDVEKALSSPDGSPSPSPSRRADAGGEERGNGEATEEEEEEEDDEEEVVEITSDDITKMGLDPWSESDRLFVEELVNFYWGRRARVKAAGNVECCGVRVF
ncbi:MAG: hypothetical protein Q9212_003589 [Teloschistes hypoglaucus]